MNFRRAFRWLCSALIIVLSVHFGAQISHAQVPNIKWEQTYGGTSDESAQSIVRTKDSGYVIAGWTSSTNGDIPKYYGGFSDVWIVKIDSVGRKLWSKTYGGSGDDKAFSVAPTFDGGYIFAGVTNSNDHDVSGFNGGNYDVWVGKIDASGNLIWSKCLGGGQDDIAYSVIQTSDSGYAIAGSSNSVTGLPSVNKGANDFWVIKLDVAGKLQWKNSFGGSRDDIARTIVETSDHGYAVSGVTQSSDGDVIGFHAITDFWFVRLDSLGKMRWNKAYGGSSAELAYSMIQTKDSGFALAGFSSSSDGDVTNAHGGADFWILKIDSIGKIEWQKTFGGSNTDIATSITQTEDGGYSVAGYTRSSDGDVVGLHGIGADDYWLLKLASNGALEWQKTVGGSLDDDCLAALEIPETPTQLQKYVLAGFASSMDGDVTGLQGGKDFWVVDLEPPCFDIRVGLEPSNGTPQALSARNQDTVRIPIYALDSSVRPLQFLSLDLKLDRDLLTPIGIDTKQGQFSHATLSQFIASGDSVTMRLELAAPQKLRAGLLCVVECIANLTDTLNGSVVLSGATFQDSALNSRCIAATIQATPDNAIPFSLQTECGDSSISKFLAGASILSILSVSPNPTSSDVRVQLHVPSGYANDGTLEVLDALGRVLSRRSLQFSDHSDLESFTVSLGEGSGIRYLRMTSLSGVSTIHVVVRK